MGHLQATPLSTGLQTVVKTGYVSLESYCSLETDFLNRLCHMFTATQWAQNSVGERVTLRSGEAGSISSYKKAIQLNL